MTDLTAISDKSENVHCNAVLSALNSISSRALSFSVLNMYVGKPGYFLRLGDKAYFWRNARQKRKNAEWLSRSKSAFPDMHYLESFRVTVV